MALATGTRIGPFEIARGPIPVDDALSIVRQIAEALQAAHDQNVIHCDLKPANIKITPDGSSRCSNFGLAKLSDARETSGRAQSESSSSSAIVTFARSDVYDSPTISTPAVTSVGTILGTAAYMAPEQAKGRPADKRSDVWALGCVMYEMFTGTRPFRGEDVADTLAAVLRGEPDWTLLPHDTPPPVANVLRRCLEKDRRARAGDVAAVLFALDQARTSPQAGVVAPAIDWGRRVVTTVAWSLTAAAVAGAAVWTLKRTGPGPVTRLAIVPDAEYTFRTATGSRDLAISRDGRRVVYFGGEGRLIVRSLDSRESTVIDGLEGRTVERGRKAPAYAVGRSGPGDRNHFFLFSCGRPQRLCGEESLLTMIA